MSYPNATMDPQKEREKEKQDLKWGCVPWALVIAGICITPTSLSPLGIILIIAGAGIGGYGWGKRK